MNVMILFMDTKLRMLTLCFIVVLLGACVPSKAPATTLPPAPTATAITLYATISQTVAPVGQPNHPQIANEPTSEPIECATIPRNQRSAHYNIRATLDYTAHSIQVGETIRFTNLMDIDLNDIVLSVIPNKEPQAFTLNHIRIDDALPEAETTLEGVRLTIPLQDLLMPGCEIEIALSYTLTLPQIGTGFFPRQGYLGYDNQQLNLGHWLPVMAHHDGTDWITPEPSNIGEQTVTPSGDYTLILTVENAPENLTLVAPGTVIQQGDTWTISLDAARDLSLTMSTEYHIKHMMATNGTQVEVYTLDATQPPELADYSAPQHALDTATAALELYADLYGPYPYNRLVIVESAFPDGMEFSGLVFVGSEWFRSYQGNPAGYLTLITAHEVAHQWWYAMVGSDQSATPWMDEALCIYSEYVFLQENYPDLTDWWWAFRVDAYYPQGTIDMTVYEFKTIREYINAVYLRGAHFMHDLRQAVGTEAYFAWLHQYAETFNHQVATPADFWSTLPEDQHEAVVEVLQAYLREQPASIVTE